MIIVAGYCRVAAHRRCGPFVDTTASNCSQLRRTALNCVVSPQLSTLLAADSATTRWLSAPYGWVQIGSKLLVDLRLLTIRKWVQSITQLRRRNGDHDLLWTCGRVHNILDLFRAGEACTTFDATWLDHSPHSAAARSPPWQKDVGIEDAQPGTLAPERARARSGIRMTRRAGRVKQSAGADRRPASPASPPAAG
jgi:hypothetical protein